MAANDHATYRAFIECSDAGPSNPAIATLTQDRSGSYVTKETVHVLFAAFLSFSVCGSDSAITKMTYRDETMAGEIDLPFNATKWDLIRTIDTWLPAATDWGFVMGDGPLAPPGTSALYLEKTAKPGRSYTGRLNVPYFTSNLLSDAGTIDASLKTALQERYARYLFGAGHADNSEIPALGASPAVYSKLLDKVTPITSVSVQTNPSRLRSRQR